MRKLGRWFVVAIVLLAFRRLRRARERPVEAPAPEQPGLPAIVEHNPRAEGAVLLALVGATLFAAAFVAVYAVDRLPRQTQLLGITLGGAFALLAVACIVTAKRIVPDQEIDDEYSRPHQREQREVVEIVEGSKRAFTRRKLIGLAAGGAATALGVALITPAASLGPVLDTDALHRTPWRRGRRLVDADGRPLLAADIGLDSFYTAYPENESWDDLAAPLVLVRLEPKRLHLPPDRATWAPQGILAYSKICTHAGCAVSEYRAPLFEPTSARPALVCPCHYSTFDPAAGGTVLFGPAGRPLPQLPLLVDDRGHLRAAGGFSGAPGPSWWGVRQP